MGSRHENSSCANPARCTLEKAPRSAFRTTEQIFCGCATVARHQYGWACVSCACCHHCCIPRHGIGICPFLKRSCVFSGKVGLGHERRIFARLKPSVSQRSSQHPCAVTRRRTNCRTRVHPDGGKSGICEDSELDSELEASLCL
jgi:hypothetical protein